MDTKQLQEQFIKIYGENDRELKSFLSPGRVNLIGEHIDYNGGYVFPCALSFGTYAIARKRTDNVIKFASTNFELKVETTTDKIEYNKDNDWANYPIGVVKEFQNKGLKFNGFEILVSGTIPNGAGLSSSASLEVLTAVIINDLYNFRVNMVDMVKMSQSAERNFVGVNCGIMDQFAVGMGKKDHVILLDCNTINYEYVPLKLKGAKLIIGNTNKRRGLADSKYNERRLECEKALEELKQELNINALCELDVETFEKYKFLIKDEIRKNRAAHAVYENMRVKEAVKKLNEGDIDTFGKLMNKSHESLRDLYEVTGTELDTMVEEAWKIKGTIGSRMTGAGFGGCTISIVKEEAVDDFIAVVGKKYEERTGIEPSFYVAEVGDGAKELI